MCSSDLFPSHDNPVPAGTSDDDFAGNDAMIISDPQPIFRGKRHDYFTSALPWPQKGPGVELPLSGNAPVYSKGAVGFTDGSNHFSYLVASSTNRGSLGVPTSSNSNIGGPGSFKGTGSDGSGLLLGFDSSTNVYADLSSVTAATINSLRLS